MRITSILRILSFCSFKGLFSLSETTTTQHHDFHSPLHHNVESKHRRIQEDPSWEPLGDCIYGRELGVELGRSISLSGDGNLMITESHRGVYLNQYDPELGWTEAFDFTDILVNPGQNGNYELVISSDGSRIAVGSPYNGEQGFRSGAVQVFEREITNEEVWTQVGATLFGTEEGQAFGSSLDLSENGGRIVIGAIGGGFVQVFSYQDQVGQWSEDRFYSGTTIQSFGHDVAMSGDGNRIIVGAPDQNNKAGFVRIYELSDIFIESIKEEILGAQFGKAVDISLDGTTVAIGSPGNGKVEFFQFDEGNNEWIKYGNTITVENESFGSSLSLSSDGSMVIIGAPTNSDFGPGAGNAYVYEYDDQDNWSSVGDNSLYGETPNEKCGTSVALSSNNENIHIAVGCPGDDTFSFDAGSACAFFLFIPSSSPTLISSSTPSYNPTASPSISQIPTKAPVFFPTTNPSVLIVPTPRPSPLPTTQPPTRSPMTPTDFPTINSNTSYESTLAEDGHIEIIDLARFVMSFVSISFYVLTGLLIGCMGGLGTGCCTLGHFHNFCYSYYSY